MKCENCQFKKATSVIKVGNPDKSIQLQLCSNCTRIFTGKGNLIKKETKPLGLSRMPDQQIRNFVTFAKTFCHTMGEQKRIDEAAKAFLNPPRKFSFSKQLKKHI